MFNMLQMDRSNAGHYPTAIKVKRKGGSQIIAKEQSTFAKQFKFPHFSVKIYIDAMDELNNFSNCVSREISEPRLSCLIFGD